VQQAAWLDINLHSRDTQIVWFCLLMLADGIGGCLFYFYGGSHHMALASVTYWFVVKRRKNILLL
jgi:hypothetical protein